MYNVPKEIETLIGGCLPCWVRCPERWDLVDPQGRPIRPDASEFQELPITLDWRAVRSTNSCPFRSDISSVISHIRKRTCHLIFNIGRSNWKIETIQTRKHHIPLLRYNVYITTRGKKKKLRAIPSPYTFRLSLYNHLIQITKTREQKQNYLAPFFIPKLSREINYATAMRWQTNV